MENKEPALEKSSGQKITIAVIAAALGYFVDIYDLILFSIVRVKSLKGLGITDPAQVFSQGTRLISFQMYGMLLGGILWGILGDRKGRLSVLFGSILIYSLANIANAFVTGADGYAACRFIAGVGLAGELGAGITLVSELMSKETRGIGTALVASIGILGAVFGFLIGDTFQWQIAFIVGGVMGLVLLAFRFSVVESGMFKGLLEKKASRGNFLTLFSSPGKILKYASVILIGLPIWFLVGILVTFSPEIGKALGMSVPPSAGKAIMFTYIGLAAGDLGSGLISQFIKSRKKTALGFIVLLTGGMVFYFFGAPFSTDGFYLMCTVLGIFGGYWALFVTIAAEQFGTDIRATVATTAPNFVRGLVAPMVTIFAATKTIPALGVAGSAMLIGGVTVVLALMSLLFIHETFGKDLDYIEEQLP